MIKSIACLLVIISSFSVRGENLIDNAETFIKNKDYLGLRIYLKKNSVKKLSTKDWKQLRSFIQNYPNVGYDLVFNWDKLSMAAKDNNKVNEAISLANNLFSERKFSEAYAKYEEAAKTLMSTYKKDIPTEHQMIYYWVLQQMGRSLYSQTDYANALTIYSWIPLNYFNFRQVLFEKMWAGFMSQRYDVALGSIISQQSAYFSPYLEPDSYLLKYYIYKQLCKEAELKKLTNEVKTFINLIKNNKYQLKDWSKQDFYNLSLYKLTEKSELADPQLDLVNQNERNAEIAKIKKSLEARFQIEKERLLIQLGKVLGYSILIKKSEQELQKIKKFPDGKILEKKGFEFWTYKDQEEWTDEVGSHYYVGESECTNKK